MSTTAVEIAPRHPPVSQRLSWRAVALLLAATIACAAVLCIGFFFDPATTPWLPPCVFHRLTGLHCPGCGATRCVHHLAHGRLLAALHSNVLLPFAAPVLAFALLQYIRGAPLRRPAGRAGAWLGWAIALTIIGFAVLRNIPLFPLTLLAP